MVTGDPICPHCGSHWWSAHACSGALLGQRYETSDPMDPHKLAESVRELSERNDQLSAELSALKNRVEAAEKEVSERGKDVSMLTSYLRHAMMCGDLDGDCSTCTEARDLLARIDAALQAARETP